MTTDKALLDSCLPDDFGAPTKQGERDHDGQLVGVALDLEGIDALGDGTPGDGGEPFGEFTDGGLRGVDEKEDAAETREELAAESEAAADDLLNEFEDAKADPPAPLDEDAECAAGTLGLVGDTIDPVAAQKTTAEVVANLRRRLGYVAKSESTYVSEQMNRPPHVRAAIESATEKMEEMGLSDDGGGEWLDISSSGLTCG